MTKSAAKSFTDGLRIEMSQFGIKVCNIAPFVYR